MKLSDINQIRDYLLYANSIVGIDSLVGYKEGTLSNIINKTILKEFDKIEIIINEKENW